MALTLNMKLSRVQYNPRAVMTAKERAALRVHKRFGAYVRRNARKRLRMARRKRMSELTAEERQAYHIREAYAEMEGRPKPKLPLKPSERGKPPRLHYKGSPLKSLLVFDADPENVVIGPKLFHGKTPSKIGHHEMVSPTMDRPYMIPSFDDELPKVPDMWRDVMVK